MARQMAWGDKGTLFVGSAHERLINDGGVALISAISFIGVTLAVAARAGVEPIARAVPERR